MGKNQRLRVSSLTAKEYTAIKEAANFTPEQLAIYESLNHDEVYDIGIMMMLNISSRKYYDLKKVTVDKIERIAQELGYIHIIKRH